MSGSNPGERRGGRQRGTPNKATAEVRELALEYGPAAVKELATLAGLMPDGVGKAQSEPARVSACNAIIERAYGKTLPGRMIFLELPDTSTAEGVKNALSIVVDATASGEITTSEASDLCGVLDSQRRAIELTDIEARLSALEAQRAAA